jgi:hypothetical protein
MAAPAPPPSAPVADTDSILRASALALATQPWPRGVPPPPALLAAAADFFAALDALAAEEASAAPPTAAERARAAATAFEAGGVPSPRTEASQILAVLTAFVSRIDGAIVATAGEGALGAAALMPRSAAAGGPVPFLAPPGVSLWALGEALRRRVAALPRECLPSLAYRVARALAGEGLVGIDAAAAAAAGAPPLTPEGAAAVFVDALLSHLQPLLGSVRNGVL